MSNVEAAPVEQLCGGEPAPEAVFELMDGREVQLTPRSGTNVVRTLPNRERRMVGAWCFLDQYGPTPLADGGARHERRRAPAHRTADGQLARGRRDPPLRQPRQQPADPARPAQPDDRRPRDRPRGAVAHAQQRCAARRAAVGGAAGEHAGTEPHFEHHADLPVLDRPGATVTVLMGSLDGATSSAKAYSPLVGAEIDLESEVDIPLRKDFEHAILVLSGSVQIGPSDPRAGTAAVPRARPRPDKA